jgi:energy-coupling factor transporter ATP-binding protein EcfA2
MKIKSGPNKLLENYLDPIDFVKFEKDEQNIVLTLGVPNRFFYFYANENLKDKIYAELKGIYPELEINIQFIITEKVNQDYNLSLQNILQNSEQLFQNIPSTNKTVFAVEKGVSNENINTDLTFSTFVVGKNSEFAHAATYNVAQNPGVEDYNPLFIYGPSGMGKTHLLNAAANHIKENESPFSNPRFLLVLAITFVGLWGWQYFINKKYPPAVVTKAVQTETVAAAPAGGTLDTQKAVGAAALVAAKNQPAIASIEQFNYVDENVSFSISSLGFTFTSFSLNDYKDHSGNQVQFVNDDAFFALHYHGAAIPFAIKVSDDKLSYIGVAQIEGKELKRTLTFNKDLKSFSSTTASKSTFLPPKILLKKPAIYPPNYEFFDFESFNKKYC